MTHVPTSMVGSAREPSCAARRVVATSSRQEPAIDRNAALQLLARSIAFGHAGLAVVRLSIAVRVGAQVPPEHWRYCREVVTRTGDAALETLLESALFSAGSSGGAGITPS